MAIVTQNITAPWTAPPGVTTVSFVIEGDGGGAGGGDGTGGGGGGSIGDSGNPVTPGQTYFTFGPGGAGGADSLSAGADGSGSTFTDDNGTIYTAFGGQGGQPAAGGGGAGGTSSIGGTNTPFSPVQNVGGNGDPGSSPGNGGGGGGAGVAGTGNGQNGSGMTGGMDGAGGNSGGDGTQDPGGGPGSDGQAGGGGGGGDITDGGGAGGAGLGTVTYDNGFGTPFFSSDGITITVPVPDTGGGSGDGTGFTVTPSDYISGFQPVAVALAGAGGTTLSLQLENPMLFWYASQTVTLQYDGSNQGLNGLPAFGPVNVDLSALSQYKPVIAYVGFSTSTRFNVALGLDTNFTNRTTFNANFDGSQFAVWSARSHGISYVCFQQQDVSGVGLGNHTLTVSLSQQSDAFPSNQVDVTISDDPPLGIGSTITVYQNGTPIVLTWDATQNGWIGSNCEISSWLFYWGMGLAGLAITSDTFFLASYLSGIVEFDRLVTFTAGTPAFTMNTVWLNTGTGWAFDSSTPDTGFAPSGALPVFSSAPNLTLAGTAITMLLTETGNAFSATNSDSDFTFTGVADPSGITISLPQGSSTMTLSGAGLDAASDVSYDGSLTILDGDGNEFAAFSNVPLADAPSPPEGGDSPSGRLVKTNYERWQPWL